MYPLIWFWIPIWHSPWSGNWAQSIQPEVFFGSIRDTAGDGRVEQRAFNVASYGRQLGWLSEVVIAMAEKHDAIEGKAAKSLERLVKIQNEIKIIKDQEYRLVTWDLEDRIERFKNRHPEHYAIAKERLLRVLRET